MADTKVTIDLSNLDEEIYIASLIILELLNQGNRSTLSDLLKTYPGNVREGFKMSLEHLHRSGYINIEDYRNSHGDVNQIYLLDKGRLNNDNERPVEEWIDEWRKLFPKGVRTGGYPVRGSRKGCLKKMRSFLKNRSDVSPEDIFKITERYVESKRKVGFNYMKIADYFIEKDGFSPLESMIDEGVEEPRTQSFTENI